MSARREARNNRKSSANSYAPAHSVVGADAHIGPLGSDEFTEDFRKKWYILRADRVVRPYGVRMYRKLTVGADDSVGPFGKLRFRRSLP